MLVFIIAFIFGAGQVMVTEQLINSFNKRESKKILLFFGAKFLLYCVAIGLLIIKFIWHLSLALCGFAVGVPITAIALYVYRVIYKEYYKFK